MDQANRAQSARRFPIEIPVVRRSGVFRTFLDWQMDLCRRFDRMLPGRYRIDGKTDFMQGILPRYLRPELTVYDVGGGKSPAIARSQRRLLHLVVIGLDVDPGELARAPEGSYDARVVADIATHRGAGDGDLVICQGVLEHVADTSRAFAGLASLLRPGGTALIFVPNRLAPFSLLNRLVPEVLKRRLLFALFPGKKHGSGFPAPYDRCTPRHFRDLAEAHGFGVVALRPYYLSRYFSFLLPLYVAWRMYVLIAERLAGEQGAETFSMILEKRQGGMMVATGVGGKGDSL